jgi:hypothetical protein
VMSGPPLFTGSTTFTWREFQFEALERDAYKQNQALAQLAPAVLELAARSRGWCSPDEQEGFRRDFKIGPLFEARGLALVWRQEQLVGIAGCVNDWWWGERQLLHLCSLGIAPEAQSRGLLPGLMLLLWSVLLRSPATRLSVARGTTYVSAITQSPYLMHYFDNLFEIFPSPDREPDEVVRDLAGAVVDRYDPDVKFEPDKLILRGECRFRYRDLPVARNRRWTAYCLERLDYDRGDVFVAIGKVVPAKLNPILRRTAAMAADLAAAIDSQVNGSSSLLESA